MEYAEKGPKWNGIDRFYQLFTGEWIDLEHVICIREPNQAWIENERYDNWERNYFEIEFLFKTKPVIFSIRVPEVVAFEGQGITAELTRLNSSRNSGGQPPIILQEGATFQDLREALNKRREKATNEFRTNHAAFIEDVKKYKNKSV